MPTFMCWISGNNSHNYKSEKGIENMGKLQCAVTIFCSVATVSDLIIMILQDGIRVSQDREEKKDAGSRELLLLFCLDMIG